MGTPSSENTWLKGLALGLCERTSNVVDIEKIAKVICLFLGVSLSMIFINFYLYTRLVNLPIFISWLQMLIALMCTIPLGLIYRPGRQADDGTSSSFSSMIGDWPVYSFDLKVAVGILPLAVSYTLMIGFNSLCLVNVTVSTYQIARSLTIGFNVLLTYLILRIKTSKKVIFACLIVAVGFFIGTFDTESMTPLGIVMGIMGSFFWALYSVTVKKYMKNANIGQMELLNYNITLSCLLFIPLIFISGEHNNLRRLDSGMMVPVCILVTGLVGFLMNIAVFLLIKYTSPLTHTIVGTFKAVIQTAGGFSVFGETPNVCNMSGIVLTTVGIAYYGFARLQEQPAPEGSSKAVARRTGGYDMVNVYDTEESEGFSEDAAGEATDAEIEGPDARRPSLKSSPSEDEFTVKIIPARRTNQTPDTATSTRQDPPTAAKGPVAIGRRESLTDSSSKQYGGSESEISSFDDVSIEDPDEDIRRSKRDM